MSNSLIVARNAFVAGTPERRVVINTREWGVIRVGDTGPGLVLIPGTLGRADVFWHKAGDVEGVLHPAMVGDLPA